MTVTREELAEYRALPLTPDEKIRRRLRRRRGAMDHVGRLINMGFANDDAERIAHDHPAFVPRGRQPETPAQMARRIFRRWDPQPVGEYQIDPPAPLDNIRPWTPEETAAARALFAKPDPEPLEAAG